MNVPYTQPQESASGRAITVLVLGILGILMPCCIPIPAVAWFLGSQELKAIQAGTSPRAGEGFAKVGWILGIIGTVLALLTLLWIFVGGGMAFLQAWRQSH